MSFRWFAPEPVLRIRVYRRTLLGYRLAGCVFEDGRTFTPVNSKESTPLFWSLDTDGTVNLRLGSNHAAVGKVQTDGTVWSEVGRPLSGAYGPYEPGWRAMIPRTFRPGKVFQVNAAGEVRAFRWWGRPLVGRVDGTSDARVIGALALLTLLDQA